MAEPYLAEIRIVGFNFAPRGWANCDGEILPINQNQSLYSILGTTYGGDGRTSFALPDLRGRTPIHAGSNGTSSYSLGQKGGEETHALTAAEIPGHTHTLQAQNDVPLGDEPNASVLAQGLQSTYVNDDSSKRVGMASSAVSSAGGGGGHNNMQPFLSVRYIIALLGTFPPRN